MFYVLLNWCDINKNYIEFSISIWRNVPVVNTKLCRITVVVTSLHQWTDAKDEWGHKASPCCKLKCPFENNLWHYTTYYCTLKFWPLIDKLKVYGIQFNKLGLATFWGEGGGSLLWGPLLSGFTSGQKKIDVNFGGSLLSKLYGML